jgi:hypothetical protein
VELVDENGMPAMEKLGQEPLKYGQTVVSSREALQPRREQQPCLADRAAGAHANASGSARPAEKRRRGQGMS